MASTDTPKSSIVWVRHLFPLSVSGFKVAASSGWTTFSIGLLAIKGARHQRA
jgi:hypothetical protein